MRKTAFIWTLALIMIITISSRSFAEGKDPVIFVHGLAGSNSNWDDMIAYFSSNSTCMDDNGITFSTDGPWTEGASSTDPEGELYTFSYNASTTSIKTSASKLSTKINTILSQTGKTRVDIISHSLGSIVTRYYLKNTTGAKNKVDTWLSLGGPNNGCDGWNYGYCCTVWGSTGCCAMKPTGTIITNLNSTSNGGPTPRTNSLPRYITVRSSDDTNAVLNNSVDKSVILPTADLNVLTDNYLPAANALVLSHNQYLSTEALFQHLMYYIHLRNFVAGYER